MLGFINKAKAVVSNVRNYAGNKDYIEGVCAAIALIAAADGNISDAEVAQAIDTAKNNRTLTAAGFSERDIVTTLDTMLGRAKGFTGRLQLLREIDEVRSRDTSGQLSEDIVASAIDVAAADGDISDAELKVVRQIAEKLRVDLRKLGFDA